MGSSFDVRLTDVWQNQCNMAPVVNLLEITLSRFYRCFCRLIFLPLSLRHFSIARIAAICRRLFKASTAGTFGTRFFIMHVMWWPGCPRPRIAQTYWVHFTSGISAAAIAQAVMNRRRVVVIRSPAQRKGGGKPSVNVSPARRGLRNHRQSCSGTAWPMKYREMIPQWCDRMEMPYRPIIEQRESNLPPKNAQKNTHSWEQEPLL